MIGKLPAIVAILAFVLSAQIPVGVVGVYTTLGTLRGGTGTGFLISPDGEILTAFHVIHGARRIDVQWQGKVFRDVIIAKVLPEYDLAVLRIDHVPAGLTPLRLASTLYWNPGQSVRTIGYARGIPNQQLDGTIPQKGFWRSEQIRDDAGHNLFRRDNIELVPLDLTIENGLSGGPILVRDEVIGVISGSLATGRGLAWGIPVSYLRFAQTWNVRATQVSSWPDFAMTRDWVNVRALHRIDNALTALFDEYLAAIDALERESEIQESRAAAADVGVRVAIAALGAQDDDREGVLKTLQPLREFGKGGPRLLEAAMKARSVGTRLFESFGVIGDRLPRTLLNWRNVRELDGEMKAMMHQWQAADQPYDENKCGNVIASATKISSVGDAALVRMLQEMDRCLVEYLGPNWTASRHLDIQKKRDLADLMRSALSRPQDLVSEAKRYSSRGGYRFVLPRGWIFWSTELDKVLPTPVGPPPEDADLYLVGTGFFGDGRLADDLILIRAYPKEPIGDDDVISVLKDTFIRSGRESLPGFRQPSIERTTIGNYTGIVADGIYGAASSPSYRRLVELLGPTRMITVDCYIAPGGNLGDCNALVASLEID